MEPQLILGVCFVFICSITITVSEPKFSWNPGNTGLNANKDTLRYTNNLCGLNSARDQWRLEDGVLNVVNETLWDKTVYITAKTAVCQIDLTTCNDPKPPQSEYCRCTSMFRSTSSGTVYALAIRQNAKRTHSEGTVRAGLFPAEQFSHQNQPVVSVIGTLPFIYDPIVVTLKVNSEAERILIPNTRFDVLATTNLTLKYCAKNILAGASLRASVNNDEKVEKGECINITTRILGYNDYQLSFSYNEVYYKDKEHQDCNRFRYIKGVARLDHTAMGPNGGPNRVEDSDKFDNLETIYGVMLGVMAAIFLVVCAVAWYWYYRTKRNMKISREQELQGTLDFDKFDSRIEDSHI